MLSSATVHKVFWKLLCFPEGLAPADSLNDPAAESNGHELTSSAVTSAVARLASTFGPAAKIQTPAPQSDVTNGVAVTAQVGDGSRWETVRHANNTLTCLCVCVQKPSIQVKSSMKDSRWYDVGIVKVTNMVVTHYYVPYDNNVIDVRVFCSAGFKQSTDQV